MDPATNPLAPEAGTPTPELTARNALRASVRTALERTRRGLPALSVRAGRAARRGQNRAARPAAHERREAAASALAIATLDQSFFRVRFERLTPAERKYLRAMAELGPGPHRSGDVANSFGRKVTALAMTRNKLIDKGMLWSPAHGDTAFTVPLFDEFMRRIMPGEAWRA